MKLTEKGKIQPPIELPKFPEHTSQAVQAMPNVISATHWDLYRSDRPDGADFYVGQEELGHIHINGDVHLATNKQLKKLLLSNQLAKPFPYTGGVFDNWVEFKIRTLQDAQHAIHLFRLNYMRLLGKEERLILEEIKQMSLSR